MAGPTLTAAGLTIQTVAEIAAEALGQLKVNANQPGLLAAPGSAVGATIQTIADRERSVQEALQASHTSFSIDASGVAQDRVAQAFGLARLVATKSTGTNAVTNTSGGPVTITVGSQLRDTNTGDQFETTAAFTIPAAGGDLLTIVANEFGAIPVPGGAWEWITSGYTAITFGALTASAQGLDAETDAELRSRWLVSYAVAGAGTVDSLVTALRALDGTTDARVFENTSPALGIATPEIISALPAKAVVAVMLSTATASDIVAEIWSHKPAGIETFGASSGTVVDAQGVTQTIAYQTAAAVTANIVVTVTGSDSSYDAATDAAVTALIAALTISDDLNAQRLECAVLDASALSTVLVAANINGLGDGVDLAVAWDRYASIGSITTNHV